VVGDDVLNIEGVGEQRPDQLELIPNRARSQFALDHVCISVKVYIPMGSSFILAATGGRDRCQAIPALCALAGLIIASLALATPVAAQAPGSTTTVFDGLYAGVSRENTWITRSGTMPMLASPAMPSNDARCGQNGVLFPLTITNGIVRSTPDYWEGTVSPQGIVVMRNGTRMLTAQIDNQGIIRGQRSGIDCATTWVWRKQSG
jgi:hypothetical protein